MQSEKIMMNGSLVLTPGDPRLPETEIAAARERSVDEIIDLLRVGKRAYLGTGCRIDFVNLLVRNSDGDEIRFLEVLG